MSANFDLCNHLLEASEAYEGSPIQFGLLEAVHYLYTHPQTITHPDQARGLPGVGLLTLRIISDFFKSAGVEGGGDGGDARDRNAPLHRPTSTTTTTTTTTTAAADLRGLGPDFFPFGQMADFFPDAPPEKKGKGKGKGKRNAEKAGEQKGAGDEDAAPGGPKGKAERAYRPRVRSGGYAALLALLEAKTGPNGLQFLTKDDLSAMAQKYCDADFAPAKPHHYRGGGGGGGQVI